VLAPSGLRSTQFIVLVGVFRGFGATMTGLGKALGMDRSSLSRNLLPLLRRRLISIVPATARRRRALQAMRRGERVLARTIPYWRTAQQQVLEVVGADKWETLGGDLRGLATAIRVSVRTSATGRGSHTVCP
jgi:DNA-binding MarR family transcriptional regulator